MNKWWWFIILCLGICACNKSTGQISVSDNSKEADHRRDLTETVNSFADSLLTVLTLEERVGQCLMPSMPALADSTNIDLLHKYIKDYHIGGIVLLKGNLDAVKKISSLSTTSKIPLFIAIDAEWGLGMRLQDAPVYPKNGYLSPDLETTELFDYGRKIAEDCGNVGINMVLGPVIDIKTESSKVIGDRAFGGDPELVADYGVAYAKGLESGGVISVAKHFPGHGGALYDSHKNVATLNREISKLDSLDLRPFRDYINSGLSGIMAGHIQAKALDPNGMAASVSMDILTHLLREEMKFNGLVLTDAFDMGGAKGFSALEALKAGADIILCPIDLAAEYNQILEEVAKDPSLIKIVDARCRKILFYKYLFNIL